MLTFCLAVEISNQCPANDIELDVNEGFLHGSQIQVCSAANSNMLRIKAKEGQRLNISMLSLSGNSDEIFGSIKDPSNGNMAVLGGGARYQHVIEASSNAVEINIQNQQSSQPFLLYFKGTTLLIFCL